MKIHRIHSGSGESLVEVTVSAVIFLMMMAVLQGSISFCTNAQHKSEEIRQENAEICRNLQSASYIPGAENMKTERQRRRHFTCLEHLMRRGQEMQTERKIQEVMPLEGAAKA